MMCSALTMSQKKLISNECKTHTFYTTMYFLEFIAQTLKQSIYYRTTVIISVCNFCKCWTFLKYACISRIVGLMLVRLTHSFTVN